MDRPPLRTLVILSVRRTLGVALFLDLFYVAATHVWGLPALEAADVLAILVVVFLGVWLGIGFSFVAPLPAEKGTPRVVRTLLLTVPAIGIGVAIQLLVEGPQGDRAFHVMFALAAWLGSTFVREGDPDG